MRLEMKIRTTLKKPKEYYNDNDKYKTKCDNETKLKLCGLIGFKKKIKIESFNSRHLLFMPLPQPPLEAQSSHPN